MPAATPTSLLLSRRFLPLFVTQMLGAVNDNLFKNALGVMALFLSTRYGAGLVAVGLGVFIAPYVLFSSVAGELADRTDKARLIRFTKLWELGLMLLGAAGFLAAKTDADAAGDRAVLTTLADPGAKLGLVLYDMKATAEIIAEILG